MEADGSLQMAKLRKMLQETDGAIDFEDLEAQIQHQVISFY